MNCQTTNQIEPSIQFRNLSKLPTTYLLDCFNASFEGYFVPLQLTKQLLLEKIKVEAIDLSLSVGAFDNDKLVGFILQGIDDRAGKRTAYNAGTGVLPAYRGAKITSLMYVYALDLLRLQNINNCVLEVIVENIPALQSYKKVGFEICRQLNSYQPTSINRPRHQYNILEMPLQEMKVLNIGCEWKPAWQYKYECLLRAFPAYKLWVVIQSSIPVAYVVGNVNTASVAHFGCLDFKEYPAELKALLWHMEHLSGKRISVIHIDNSASQSNRFLKSVGFVPCIAAYEMELCIRKTTEHGRHLSPVISHSSE